MWEDIINIPHKKSNVTINNINNFLKEDQYIIIGCSDNWLENIAKIKAINLFEYENSNTILFELA